MENIVIITGASRGIGLGLAKEFHRNGFRVVSIARSKIEKFYAAEQYSCDLIDGKAIESTLTEIFSHFNATNTGKLYLINNAGDLGTVNTIDQIPFSDIGYTIQLNLSAPLMLSSLFIKLSKTWKCDKKIINISSGAAVNPYESWAMYCSSKAGLDMMTRVIAKEQKELSNGVAVVSVYPGIVDTEMQKVARSTPKEQFKSVQRFIDFHKHGELKSPDEVARKIFALDQAGELKSGKILDIRNF